MGGKGGRCVRLTTLPPSCAVALKSGNLNFLEPSWTLRACNGTALYQDRMCDFMCEITLVTNTKNSCLVTNSERSTVTGTLSLHNCLYLSTLCFDVITSFFSGYIVGVGRVRTVIRALSNMTSQLGCSAHNIP